ncbi:hypothetical protein [Candidatus Palauibacter sp.]|uniref:hypothetical protein n=1 Tax=Candidatus Palauibacter sp. TaxID=3101350 RepID=UPI003CC66E07
MHENYVGLVKPNIDKSSPTSQLFSEAGPGQYSFNGEKLVGASDLIYSGGALATDGKLPDHEHADAANWETVPVRIYIRRALDNFVDLLARGGPGSFEDLSSRIFSQQWDALERMQIRSAIGAATGIICKVDGRTSGTVFTVKDGYGHAGTDPLMHLEPGMAIAWIDTSNSNAVGGASRIASIDYSAASITIDSASKWEPGTDMPAAGDLIVFCTTPDTTKDYFTTEYNRQKNGILTIVDPDDELTTVFNISQSDYPRWKPYKEISTKFDHIELTEHWSKGQAKSTSPMNATTHTCIANGAVLAELARTLVGFQQQTQLGRTFRGGYQAVQIAGIDFVKDDWFLHDVVMTLSHEDLFNVDLGGGADYMSEDGSMYSRLADFDGREWYIAEYCNSFSDRRNRHFALGGISLPNVSATDFSPSPNY